MVLRQRPHAGLPVLRILPAAHSAIGVSLWSSHMSYVTGCRYRPRPVCSLSALERRREESIAQRDRINAELKSCMLRLRHCGLCRKTCHRLPRRMARRLGSPLLRPPKLPRQRSRLRGGERYKHLANFCRDIGVNHPERPLSALGGTGRSGRRDTAVLAVRLHILREQALCGY